MDWERAQRRLGVERVEPRRSSVSLPATAPALLLQLQCTAGNRAVAATFSAPPAPRLARRPEARVSHDDAGAITRVDFKEMSRPPGSLAGGEQGQHITAYGTFEAMILNHLVGKTLAAAKHSLNLLLDAFATLPEGQDALVGEWKRRTDLARTVVDEVIDFRDLGKAIYLVISARQMVPESARHAKGGGKGEAGALGHLQMVEKYLRDGALDRVPDTEIDPVAYDMWRLLDPPTARADPDRVTAIMAQHIASLRLSYPRTFERFPTLTTRMGTFLMTEDHRAVWLRRNVLPGRKKQDIAELVNAIPAGLVGTTTVPSDPGAAVLPAGTPPAHHYSLRGHRAGI